MANKIRFYALWNARNMMISIGVVLSLVIVLAFIFYYPQITTFYKLRDKDSEVVGQVLEVSEERMIRQTKLGNTPRIENYVVKYSYIINGEKYVKEERIPGTRRNGALMFKSLENDSSIVILYNATDPSKSMIDLK